MRDDAAVSRQVGFMGSELSSPRSFGFEFSIFFSFVIAEKDDNTDV